MTNNSNLRRFIVFVLLLFGFEVLSRAQEPNSHGDTPTLIERLKDQDETIAISAEDQLVNRGSMVIPALITFLSTERECLPRVLAASVIYKLELMNEF